MTKVQSAIFKVFLRLLKIGHFLRFLSVCKVKSKFWNDKADFKIKIFTIQNPKSCAHHSRLPVRRFCSPNRRFSNLKNYFNIKM